MKRAVEPRSIVEAKAHLSEMVAAARETGEAQPIANRGRVVAVVVDIERFERMRQAEGRPPEAWRNFLAASARLREEGGASLPLPKRRGRPVPRLGGR